MLLLFVVYYTVLSTAVARREEGVLQRLRTGEAADAEILTALAVPAVAITLVQTLVLAVAGAAVIDLPLPQDPLLTLAGVLLGGLRALGDRVGVDGRGLGERVARGASCGIRHVSGPRGRRGRTRRRPARSCGSRRR